jgi:hypothetical protein
MSSTALTWPVTFEKIKPFVIGKYFLRFCTEMSE